MRKSILYTLVIGFSATAFFGLLALISALFFFSYQPDTGAVLLCGLGSQDACAQVQQTAALHSFAFLSLFCCIIFSVFSLLVTGIISLALLVP